MYLAVNYVPWAGLLLATIVSTIYAEHFLTQVLTIEADVNNEDDVKRTIESTMKHFGQLDILVSLQFSGML